MRWSLIPGGLGPVAFTTAYYQRYAEALRQRAAVLAGACRTVLGPCTTSTSHFGLRWAGRLWSRTIRPVTATASAANLHHHSRQGLLIVLPRE